MAKLTAKGGGTSTIAISGWGGALTNGTLGNFTIHWNGTLSATAAGGWTFSGTIDFYDYWDFDPKPFGGGSGRPLPAEIKVRVASAALPGKPFDIFSIKVPATQTSTDDRATWAVSGPPKHVGDKAGRTGADVEVGAAGGAAGGPETEAAGGAAGAQSSEDLNK